MRARRLLRAALLLAVVAGVNFILPRLLPGSPLRADAGMDVAGLSGAAREELRREQGLDRPLGEQFGRYVAALVRGDLGRSLATHRPVSVMIAERLPWTVLLVGGAVLTALAIGGALGTLAAWRPQRPWARVAEGLVVVAGALPEFLIAMLLIVGLGAGARLFPAGGATTPFLAGTVPWWRAAGDVLWHAVLPGATLVIVLTPAFLLLTRNALAGVVGERYLLVARGKGLPERQVIRHAWRNALPAVCTLLGLRLAFAVTGAAVVERLFAYPGMGMLLVEAVARRDYPVMQGVFLVASVAVVAVTLALDLLADVLDPRLREDAA